MKMLRFGLLCALTLILCSFKSENLADYVDTSIGAVDNRGSNCVIGPMLPYGSINPSPQCPGGDTDGYKPGAPIDGFGQLHVSGTGWSSYGHFLLQPQTGQMNVAPGSHASEHSDDITRPYLYATTLDRYDVRVEVAPAHYSAIYRITYPQSDSSSLVFDAAQSIAGDIAKYMGKTLLGTESDFDPVTGKLRMMIHIRAGWPYQPYKLYLAGRVNKSVLDCGKWSEDGHDGVYLRFATTDKEQVIVKLAISFTGYERAEELLAREIPHWDFDKVADAGRRQWNDKLSCMKLKNESAEHSTMLYSALYRVFTMARDRSLDNSRWQSRYPFWDDNYAYWDTFRTAYPLLVLVDPEAARGNILSMIDRFEHNGCVYDGFIAGYERLPEQGGNDVDCVISDAFLKGLKGVPWDKAFEIVKHNADNRRIGHQSDKDADQTAYLRYKELGYIPSCVMSSSQTLEFAYNDYCAALMARGLGHEEDAERYMERSHKWPALWNPELSDGTYTGFMDALSSDGKFAFVDPVKYGGSWVTPFYEGSAWTYNYYVPHDFERLIELMGGDEVFVQRLNYGFEKKLVKYDNEPGFLASRAFVYAGRPDLSSYWVHHSMTHGFDMTGYPGNEDTGAMGSWYVFCNLGLCPNAGQDFYYLNAPMVSEATLKICGRRKLVIKANASPQNVFIKSLKVNGKPWNSAILPHSEIARGGVLEFELSSSPTSWAICPPEGPSEGLCSSRQPLGM